MGKEKDELTPEQKIFILEYLKDFNGTRAAKAAGYSEKAASSYGSQLLGNIKVQKALKKAMDEVLGDAKEDIKAIIQELKTIAFSDISDVMDWGYREETVNSMDGEASYTKQVYKITVKNKDQIGNKSKAIAEISESESMMSVSRKVKMYDKLRAIELLGKYYKMFTDKVEHTNPDGNMKPQVFVYLPKNGRES